MALRKGAEAIQQAATRRTGSFVPEIRWADKETKYVQFLHPIEDVITALMHPFIQVGERDSGTMIIEKFISRRDPNLDGPQGYDELIDRFGEQPVNRSIGLAVVLEPVWETVGTKKKIAGFEVVNRQFQTKDDETKEVPEVGLVMQSPFSFYSHLAAFADLTNIDEAVFAVKRTGASTDTTYTFMKAGEAIELPDEVDEFRVEFDFEGYIDDLADEARMKSLIGPLPDDYVVNKYSKKKTAGKAAKTSTSTRNRRPAPVEEEVEPEIEDNGPETEAPANTVGRRRRFAALRDDLEK